MSSLRDVTEWIIKRISALTRTATDANLTDSEYMAVDNPSAYTRKITVDSLATWILGRIKSLATSITTFRTGDVIPVDGPSGTAKMGTDDLLKLIAENGRNLVTMGRIGNAEEAQAAFGETPDIDNAQNNTIYALANIVGIAHLPVNSVGTLITYTGSTATNASSVQLYVSLSNELYYRGKWSNTWGDWKTVSSLKSEDIPHTFGRIGNAEEAQAAFGETPDIDNATPNSIYALANIVGIAHLPVNLGGTLYTYTGNTATNASSVQLYVSLSNELYYRGKWSNTWGDWNSIQQVISTYECGSADAVSVVLGSTPSLDNAPLNSIITLAYVTGVASVPENASGFVETFAGGSTSRFQRYYVIRDGRTFMRCKWGSAAWSEWKRTNETPVFGYISSEATAKALLNDTTSVDNAPINSVFGLNYGLQGMPTDIETSQGQLISIAGNLGGAACLQIFTTKNNNSWMRSKWGGTWNDWKKLDSGNNLNYTDAIATFEKIGACGGSFATGYSVYTDSGNTNHGIDIPENSWVQLWGRKHGISAKNFSSSGWSIKDWFASAENIAVVESNPCKVYFTLFGGGNDIQDYSGMTGLGSISDVHVGSENTNPPTFYGDYSRLIAKLQAVGGWHTKVISFTYGQAFNASKDATQLAYIQAIHDVQALYSNVYAIDLMDDAELNSFKVSPYYYVGHYSAIGYKKIADRLEVLVDKLVNDNPNNFADIQWIGTTYDIAQWY